MQWFIGCFFHVCTVEDAPPVVPERNLPLITSRPLAHLQAGRHVKQAWLETLATMEDEKLGILDLHPDVFATQPRYD